MTRHLPSNSQLRVIGRQFLVKRFLPGTGKAADRFVRASYYLNMIPQTNDPKIAAASVLSVVRNVSRYLMESGRQTSRTCRIHAGEWSLTKGKKLKIYYFENVLTPNTVWVDFAKVDFSVSADVKKLALDSEQIYAGESSAYFVATEPFQFQGLE